MHTVQKDERPADRPSRKKIKTIGSRITRGASPIPTITFAKTEDNTLESERNTQNHV